MKKMSLEVTEYKDYFHLNCEMNGFKFVSHLLLTTGHTAFIKAEMLHEWNQMEIKVFWQLLRS